MLIKLQDTCGGSHFLAEKRTSNFVLEFTLGEIWGAGSMGCKCGSYARG